MLIGTIGLAVYAQWRVHTDRNDEVGWLLLAIAAVFAVVFVAPASETPSAVAPARPAAQRSSGLLLAVRVLLGALAIGAIAGATVLSSTGGSPVVALLLWLLSGPLATGAVFAWRIAPLRYAAPPWSRAEIVALAAVMLLAALARLLWLDQLPRTYFGDEPRVAMYLSNAYAGGRIPNFFSMGWNTWPVVGLSLQGLFVPLFGYFMATLRLSSALMGTVAVLATYLLARQLSGVRVALLAAILFAIGRTGIDFSRLGITHAQILLLEPLAFALLWRGLDSGRAVHYLWTGIVSGWCLYSYNAGQLVPPLVFGWLMLGALFRPRLLRTHWRAAALLAAAFALTILPYVYFFTDAFGFGPNWDQWTIMARNRQTMGQVAEVWQTGGFQPAWALLRQQIWVTWLGFGVLPGANYILGYRRGGMLDDVSAALFVLGLAISVRRLSLSRAAFTPYWWLATVIAGGIMTVAPPAFVRMVGLLPAVAILAALPLDCVLRTATHGAGRALAAAAVIAILGGAAWDNWRTYFVEYGNERGDPISEMARYVRSLPPDNRLVLLGAEHYLSTHNELFILELGEKARNLADPAHVLPLHLPVTGALTIALTPTQNSLASYIRALYPGTVVTDTGPDGQPLQLFRAVHVPAGAVERRAGLALSVERSGAAPVDAGVADPFGAPPPAARDAERLVWSGSIYWPTDRPLALSVDAGQPTTVKVGDAPPITADGQSPAAGLITLARGWQPLRIEERVEGPRALVIKMPLLAAPGPMTRWQFRPDITREGLSATYRKPDGTTMRVIDPQLNAFAVEDRHESGGGPFVTMPFTASWRGALRVDQPGSYEFEASGSGPFIVTLDETPMFSTRVDVPEQPATARAVRTLTAGLHPIAVDWDSTKPAHHHRRLFQLFWKPPGGELELIPPPNFVRELPSGG